MCSCLAIAPLPRSCTPISTRSTHRSSSATTRALRGRAGRRRRRRRARRELRGQGVRGPHGDVRPGRPAAVSEPGRGAAAIRRLHRGEQGGVRDLPRHVTHRRADVDRRGVHRRRRPLADRRDARGDRRPTTRAGRRRGRSADHGRRRPDQVPGEGRERRSASRTGCSSWSPTRSRPSSIRSPCNGSGGSARSRRRSSTTVACTPSPTSPPCRRRR